MLKYFLPRKENILSRQNFTSDELLIYTDGGARGNPGPAAIGVYITNKAGKEIIKINQKIGETTNNTAEYQAVITALEWVKENNFNKKLIRLNFFLDSKLVVNQLNGIFKIRESHLRNLIIKVRQLEQEVGGNVSYLFIPREKNKIADFLVNSSF